MKNHYHLLFATLISSLLITKLHAAESGFYVGGGIGFTKFDTVDSSDVGAELASLGTIVNVDIDNQDFNWRLFGGYNFNQYFGIEVGYQSLGEIELNTSILTAIDLGLGPILFQNDDTIVGETDGFLLSGVAKYPVTKKLEIYAKGGAYIWETEYRLEKAVVTSPLFGTIDLTATASQSFGTISDDGVSPVFGVGLAYEILQQISIRLDFDYYTDIDDDSAYAFQGGVQYNF